jgi:hypothetical protein
MSYNLGYYFSWGNRVGRDIEKLICWFIGKAHWSHFGRLDYNEDIKLTLIDRDW